MDLTPNLTEVLGAGGVCLVEAGYRGEVPRGGYQTVGLVGWLSTFLVEVLQFSPEVTQEAGLWVSSELVWTFHTFLQRAQEHLSTG